MDEEKNREEEYGVYSEKGREELREDEDEIDILTEGFMQGYEAGEKMSKCPLCGVVLGQDFVEREIDGEIYRFCSDFHADEFMKRRVKEED